MFTDIFTESLEQQKILSFTMYSDSDTSWVGYVSSFTTEVVSFIHISPNGAYDGVVSVKIEDIERIDLDDDLCKKIAYLHQNQDLLQRLSKEYAALAVDVSDFRATLTECMEQELICGIDTKSFYLRCFVQDIQFEEVRILAIDNFGHKDGECILRLEDINYVSVGRIKELTRLMLYKNNYML